MVDKHVRPFVPGADYGDESGSDFDNAVNGVHNVTTAPGDTWYLREGLHLAVATTINVGTLRFILASGTASQRLTIRGDWPGDPAKLVCGRIPAYITWTDEGDGMFSTVLGLNHQSGATWFFQGMTLGSNGTLLTKVASAAACRLLAGSHFSSDYLNGSTLYIHLTSGNEPVDTVGHSDSLIEPDFGHALVYPIAAEYIDIINLEVQNARVTLPKSTTAGQWWSPSNCSWLGGSYKYGADGTAQIFGFRQEHTGLIWDGVEIAFSSNGIYFLNSILDDDQGTWSNMLVDNCHIHHMGTLEKGNGSPGGDSHAVGVQGGDGLTVRNTVMERCGPHIVFFSHGVAGGFQQTMQNHVVTGCTFTRPHLLSGSFSSDDMHALGISQTNDYFKLRPGFEFTGNTIDMDGIGICVRTQIVESQILINDNTFRNAKRGIFSSRAISNGGFDYAGNWKSHGNIFENISAQFIHATSANATLDPGHVIDSDNNVFRLEPGEQTSSDDLFHWNPDGNITFAEWQALSHGTNVYDPNSVMQDRTTEINTEAKLRAAGGLPFPLGPGVTPVATKDAAWLHQAGWGYDVADELAIGPFTYIFTAENVTGTFKIENVTVTFAVEKVTATFEAENITKIFGPEKVTATVEPE